MECLFCKIAQGAIPAAIIFENNDILAFHDLHPQAPKHLLIIPKQHIATINDTKDEDQALLGKMILGAKNIAQAEGLSKAGYRLVFNTNPDGGQTVYHIHLHLLGGRQMTWPPG
jgi:histidine triad (HIT) family protein